MAKRKVNDPGKGQKRASAASAVAPGDQKIRIEVLKQFRVLLRSIKRHYQWVEDLCGLSGAQVWAMAEIAAAPGIKVSNLAQELGVHLSTASNMLRRLEERALIRRMRTGEDHRVVQLQLTAKGEKSCSARRARWSAFCSRPCSNFRSAGWIPCMPTWGMSSA